MRWQNLELHPATYLITFLTMFLSFYILTKRYLLRPQGLHRPLQSYCCQYMSNSCQNIEGLPLPRNMHFVLCKWHSAWWAGQEGCSILLVPSLLVFLHFDDCVLRRSPKKLFFWISACMAFMVSAIVPFVGGWLDIHGGFNCRSDHMGQNGSAIWFLWLLWSANISMKSVLQGIWEIVFQSSFFRLLWSWDRVRWIVGILFCWIPGSRIFGRPASIFPSLKVVQHHHMSDSLMATIPVLLGSCQPILLDLLLTGPFQCRMCVEGPFALMVPLAWSLARMAKMLHGCAATQHHDDYDTNDLNLAEGLVGSYGDNRAKFCQDLNHI